MTPQTKTMLRGLALAVLVGVSVYAISMQVMAPRQASGALKGKPAPAFSLPSARDGGPTVTLDGLKGKGVILAFWATWCESCLRELPILESIHRDRAGADLAIVTVNGDGDGDRRKVQSFLKARGYALPVLADGGQVHMDYVVEGLPRTLFIGPDGVVLADHVGPLTSAQLAEHADRLSACARAARAGKPGEDGWCIASL